MTSSQRVVAGSLVGLIVALLIVGVVSGTLLRHAVQVVPAAIALALVVRRPDVGGYAAMPIFAFWIFISILIWLFLLGLSRIASGTYTTAEIILTLVMFSFSVVGGIKAVALGRPLKPLWRAATLLLFLGIQLGAMMLSFTRSIANR